MADEIVKEIPAEETGKTEEAQESSSARPSTRIQIGSQRSTDAASEAQANPVLTGTESTTSKKPPKKPPQNYPPPNVRDKLTPEMELEYHSALGDLSLDSLIDENTAGNSGTELEAEARVLGKVAKVYHEDVFIDLGGQNQGIMPLRQFDDPPEVGAEVELVVVRYNLEESLYEVSLPNAAVNVGNWDDVVEGQIVEVVVTGSNKGGLECQVSGLRGFMPMGQISIYRVENPEELVGQKFSCVITEANPDRRNLVLSHRAVMERERQEKREKLLQELAPGQIHTGIVRSLKDFGAFVDLGGVDGLVHVSQMSWERIQHPSEVLEVGQQIEVKIEKFDPETGKVGLSYCEMGTNPWEEVDAKYALGASVTGTVSKVMDFGAFVKLEPGIEGLIHISELAHGRVFRSTDVVSEGQEVDVKILAVDREQQRIGLSLRAMQAKPVKPGDEKLADEDWAPPPDAPKSPPKKHQQLKGGTGNRSGGEQFGLKW